MDFDNKIAERIAHRDVCHDLFINSISHLLLIGLPVVAAMKSGGADNGRDKDLGISNDWIADNAAFQTPSSHGVWQPSFSTYFEKSASLSKPKT